ncbi:MAG: hypothetical protein M3Q57_03800 [Pseudomonadota bacterium]|nr:hypothetical protein [Pseudomonadota bacterium]
MNTLYGQMGQPVGSIDGDAVFDKTGNQICYVFEGQLYLASSGERVGFCAGGVIYNAYGAPQAFRENCAKSVPPLAPRLSPAKPRLFGVGPDVSNLPHRNVPNFLREISRNGANAFRDGLFI